MHKQVFKTYIYTAVSLGIILKYFYSLLAKGFISRKLEGAGSDRYLVLTYHRVLPKTEVGNGVEPGMFVTPDVLRKHIRFLKKYFDIVSVDQLDSSLRSGYGSRPLCVLSFDDGWLDFYTHAWPVLRMECVPAVVYLPTAFIGEKNRFWTDRLAQILKSEKGRDIFADQLNRISEYRACDWYPFSWRFHQAIELLKDYPYKHIDAILDTCELELMDCDGTCDGRSFMNWHEVQELQASSLISFGSHTVNHAILTTLPTAEIMIELQESRENLQVEMTADKELSFCYPNGNYTPEISRMVRESGYTNAMTCDSGWNRIGADLFSLKRISMHQDVSFTDSLFAYRLIQFL